MRDIQTLGWLRCGFSGVHIYIDDGPGEDCAGRLYWEHAFVLGWWVFRWRTWQKVSDT